MDQLQEIKQLLKSNDLDQISKGIELSRAFLPAQPILQLYESVWSMTYACSTEPEFVEISKESLSKKISVLNEQDNLLPAELCSIEEVEYLDLGGFPEANNWQELARYKNLKRLDFWENNLTELPGSVYSLAKLETLYVYDELKSISPEIKKLQNLKSLQLEGNRITELADEIGELKQLEVLILAGNHLKHLPGTINALKCLRLLDVAGNPELQLSDKLKAYLKENVKEFYDEN